MKRTATFLLVLNCALAACCQSKKNVGVYMNFDFAPHGKNNTDIHSLANSLDSGAVVTVDSTKGANYGFGLYLILSDVTLDFQMSSMPSQVIGNGEFNKKFNTFGNNTSIRSDSLDLFMMFWHIRLGIGYMINNGGQFFIAPSLAYDREVGRMVVKDAKWRAFDRNNHFSFTNESNGIRADSLTQDKSTITGVSFGLRSGLFIGRGWKSGGSILVSFTPHVKYGWRKNTNLYGERFGYNGRFSFYGEISVGLGLIRKE